MNILGIGDLHLEEAPDNVKERLEGHLNLNDYDVIVTVGDIVDNPEDSPNGSEYGKQFFEELEDIGDEYGLPSVAVAGNHDYAIHSDLVKGLDHVYDGTMSVVPADELDISADYQFLGFGAESFDQLPAIDIRDYGLRSSDQVDGQTVPTYVETALESHRNTPWYTAAEDIAADLDVAVEDTPLEDDVQTYQERRQRVDPVVSDLDTELDTVALNHVGPYNTGIDKDKTCSYPLGSIVYKNVLNAQSPQLSVSGHHHYGAIDMVKTDDSSTTAIGLGKRQFVDIRMEEDDISYAPLNGS